MLFNVILNMKLKEMSGQAQDVIISHINLWKTSKALEDTKSIALKKTNLTEDK